MNAPCQDIKDVLEDNGFGDFATNLFYSNEPATPDACVTVFDSGGERPEVNYTLEYPTIQIRVRGKKGGYDNARDKAERIRDLLHGFVNQIMNGTTYIQVIAIGDILPLGPDDKDRPVFTINFSIMRTT